jgi:endonuclease-3 related protein
MREAYALMLERHGHQGWWPGETPFEVCVGAILTQNTAWTNVEKAIRHLKDAAVMEPKRLWELPEPELAGLIRPAGYFNIKARRLRSFLSVLVVEHEGSLERLFTGTTRDVRARLLRINGIGPETADSLLLYAGGHEVFVVDAYTRRIFLRHGWCGRDSSYEDVQRSAASEEAIPAGMSRLEFWQDAHAQLVRVGKTWCRPREARCAECPLGGGGGSVG